MRTNFIIFTLLAFSFSLQAQTVKKPVIIKRTATWCTFCGTWGWDFMKDLQSEFQEDEAVIIGMHFSGDLENELNMDFAQNLGGSGQPRFYLNNEDQGVNSGNGSSKLSSMRQQVDQLNNESPDFEIDMNAHKSMDDPQITSSVTITPNITDFNMDYYLASYLLEDGVMNRQTSQSGIVPHPKVLRASFSGDPFGEKIIGSGESWNGSPITFDYTLNNSIYIPSDYLDKEYDVVAIVYSYDGNKYTIEQAEHITNVSFLSSDKDIVISDFSVRNIGDQLILELEEMNDEDINFTLLGMDGSVFKSGDLIPYKVSQDEYLVDLPWMQQGMYIISLQSRSGVYSKNFVLVK